jgi:hypothetical protein
MIFHVRVTESPLTWNNCLYMADAVHVSRQYQTHSWHLPRKSLANVAEFVGKCHRSRWRMPRKSLANATEAVSIAKVGAGALLTVKNHSSLPALWIM